MELRSLQSPTVSCSIPRTGLLIHNPFAKSHFIKLLKSKKHPDAKKLNFLNYKAQATGTIRSSSAAVEAIPQDNDSKDENLVYVAGATGKVGSRTVRELLKLGCKVRAGVRSVQRAESLVKSVKQMGLDGATKNLEIVECDLEKVDEIGPALGNASVVICCIGASEKEISDITGPYRIDYLATKNLIDAATASKVNHFILVTSLGTNKFGFPAAILNLFWGVLIWKRKAEEALLGSGIPYTIVRPGGMERPTDSYKETHNLTLSLEDTLFGGQVSNLQVAELIAYMAKNRSLSYCKVVEVVAETTAPLTPFGELLEKIPSQRVEVYTPKVTGTVDRPEPSVSKGISSETSSTTSAQESTQAKDTTRRPLSPYTAYDDLKPPTSPIPKVPSVVQDVSTVEVASTPAGTDSDGGETSKKVISTVEPKSTVVERPITRPLSPYAAYEDLKPPCSPCPTPSGPRETPSIDSTPKETTDTTGFEAASVINKDSPKAVNSSHSPFPVYNDLKPPSSPSPSSPTISPLPTSLADGGSKMAAMSGNGTAQPPSNAPKSRPLSPFTMYEDLKPPTPPAPPQKSL